MVQIVNNIDEKSQCNSFLILSYPRIEPLAFLIMHPYYCSKLQTNCKIVIHLKIKDW